MVRTTGDLFLRKHPLASNIPFCLHQRRPRCLPKLGLVSCLGLRSMYKNLLRRPSAEVRARTVGSSYEIGFPSVRQYLRHSSRGTVETHIFRDRTSQSALAHSSEKSDRASSLCQWSSFTRSIGHLWHELSRIRNLSRDDFDGFFGRLLETQQRILLRLVYGGH